MSEYQRLVSYIYLYDKGIKVKNSGFAKIECKDNVLRIKMNLKGVFNNYDKWKVYLLIEKYNELQGIYVGDINSIGTNAEFQMSSAADNINGTSKTFDDLKGLAVVSAANKKYATFWKDTDKTIEYFKEYNEIEPKSKPNRFNTSFEKIFNLNNSRGTNDDELLKAMSFQNKENEKKKQMDKDRSEKELKWENIQVSSLNQNSVQEDVQVENKMKENEIRESAVRENTTRENVVRESTIEENAIREDRFRENEIRENAIRENRLRENTLRENAIRENVIRENRLRENAIRENVIRENVIRENIIRDMNRENIQDKNRRNEELQEGNLNENWEIIVEQYKKINPFPDNEIECIRIELKDLRILPKSQWVLSNNSFVLHGFYNYQYLILGKINNKFILGVPGVYCNKEKLVAGIFGFDEFRPAQVSEYKTGRFGYWYKYL